MIGKPDVRRGGGVFVGAVEDLAEEVSAGLYISIDNYIRRGSWQCTSRSQNKPASRGMDPQSLAAFLGDHLWRPVCHNLAGVNRS